MSKFNDSIKFGESLTFDNHLLKVNHTSGRLIGEVTCEERDKNGNLIFSSTETNDITLPGSIFILEQMFKTASSGHRFLHTNTMITGTFGHQSSSNNNEMIPKDTLGNILKPNTEYISDEYIFGFMVGNGGETATSIIAPKYESSELSDSSNSSSFLPIQIVKSGENNPIDNNNNTDYYLKTSDKTSGGDGDSYNYYYAKGFSSSPTIEAKWADGTGTVQSEDVSKYSAPILTYCQVILDLDEKDVRQYFGYTNSQNCYINQIGLVAGKEKWVEDDHGLYILERNNNKNEYKIPQSYQSNVTRYRKDFEDVKLVTVLNFKSKDLSNDENKLKFIYKVYCL